MFTNIRRGLWLYTSFFIVLFFMASLTACAAQAEVDFSGLAFEVTSQITEEHLEFSAFITNESIVPRDLEYSFCALNVTAYTSAERTGEPAWDGLRAEHFCPEPLFVKTLAPGERWTDPLLLERYDLSDILLEDARYYFSVSLNLNGTFTASFPAGDAYLDTDFVE